MVRTLRSILAVLILAALVAPAEAGSVLIFGGTGNTGSQVAKRLVSQGDQVTVFVRPTSNKAKLDGLSVAYVEGDVLDEASVQAAVMRVKPDTIVSTLQDRPKQASPHGAAENTIVTWAKAAGVKQLIYISSVGADVRTSADRARYPDINWDLFAPTLELKGEAERFLIASGVPYTIIRTGAIISQRGKPPHPGTGKGALTEDQSVMGAIAYSDLGELTVQCIGAMRCMNKIFHSADDSLGPEYAHWRCRRFAKDPDKECG
jgi:nucleoside-diphosphate-sugar epimerase